jgi:hypothetical protein
MDQPTEFVKHIAMRLCAAYRSSYCAESFSEVLAGLHARGYDSEGERVAWENLASLIVLHREEIEFGLGPYLDDGRLVQ